MNKQCSNCKHFYETADAWGYCREKPPAVLPQGNYGGTIHCPRVPPDWLCGRHAPIEEIDDGKKPKK